MIRRVSRILPYKPYMDVYSSFRSNQPFSSLSPVRLCNASEAIISNSVVNEDNSATNGDVNVDTYVHRGVQYNLIPKEVHGNYLGLCGNPLPQGLMHECRRVVKEIENQLGGQGKANLDFLSNYWLTDKQAAVYGVAIYPEAPSVEFNSGYSFMLYYNAAYTTEPNLFNPENCNPDVLKKLSRKYERNKKKIKKMRHRALFLRKRHEKYFSTIPEPV